MRVCVLDVAAQEERVELVGVVEAVEMLVVESYALLRIVFVPADYSREAVLPAIVGEGVGVDAAH